MVTAQALRPWVLVVLWLSSSAVLAAELSAPVQFRLAIERAEQRLLGLAGKTASAQARQEVEDFLAGALQHAWSLSSSARQLEFPRFMHQTEVDGMPGLVNPDTHYSSALLDGAGTYLIRGMRGKHSHITLQFIDSYPMIGLSRDLFVVDLDEIGVESGESFELYFGGSPRDERWWPLPAQTRAVLLRQTFSDWAAGSLTSVEIIREDCCQQAASQSRWELAARYLDEVVALWADEYMAMLRRLPVNTILPLRASAEERGGLSGQFGVIARYRIEPDEALLVRVPQNDARYQAIQLGNSWFVTPDYLRTQVSLNNMQARVSADQMYHFVVSHKDPGVWNWLQPAPGAEGYLMIRWQGIRTPLGARDQPVMERVPVEAVLARLPADMSIASPEDRSVQMDLRRHAPLLKQ